MADISASTVMKLRKMTGQGMMDCKRALQEANGDVDSAVDILRKKGLVTLAKRAGRETTEGLVVSGSSEDGKTVVLATLCCETDFVAKSDAFIAAAEKLVQCGLVCAVSEGVENILSTEIDGKSFKDVLVETVSKTGEKTEVGDYSRYSVDGSGMIRVYIHFNKKVGTMVQIETSNDDTAGSEVVKKTAADIAMHITAIKPLGLDRDCIDAETVAKEKAIYAEQVKGKPESIIEKIVEGKLKKFFGENCLLDQAFVKDDSKTVSQVLAEAAKEAGGEARITKFVRFEVG